MSNRSECELKEWRENIEPNEVKKQSNKEEGEIDWEIGAKKWKEKLKKIKESRLRKLEEKMKEKKKAKWESWD